METLNIPVVAGAISSVLFVTGNFPMLWKAFTTKDLSSYSLSNIAMSNVGNLIYWLYVASLPFGPIWLLHGFFTITTAFMLVWYLRYERCWEGLRLWGVMRHRSIKGGLPR